MDQGIYTAVSGAVAMEARLDMIANNLANLSTTGYKKDRINYEKFARILDTSFLYPGQFRTIPVDVVTKATTVDLSPGPCKRTGNSLDVAIMGNGFFVVNTPDGLRYTRGGDFHLSPEGLLVNAQGFPVQGEGGDISLDAGHVVIDARGNVSLNDSGIDKLQVVDIPPESITRQGNSLFGVKPGFAPEPVESPDIAQGHLESANVEPVKEMVLMIETQRAYDAYQRVIKTQNDAYSKSMTNVGTSA
jgi:flagellar basal-body rod protein FlgG